MKRSIIAAAVFFSFFFFYERWSDWRRRVDTGTLTIMGILQNLRVN